MAARLGFCFQLCGSDFQGGRFQWVIPPLPCLPEDALFPLMPLAGDGAEVLSVEVGMATSAEPPAS